MSSEMILERVWLLSGVIDSAPGVLEVKGGVFTVTLIDTGTFTKKGLDVFGCLHDVENLSRRLESGPVEFFKSNFKNGDRLTFPWFYFGGGAVAQIDGQKLKISFAEPQNATFPAHKVSHPALKAVVLAGVVNDVKHARSLGSKLKNALAT